MPELIRLVKCKMCGEKLTGITSEHLRKHKMTVNEYLKTFPNAEIHWEENLSEGKQVLKG